MPNLQTLRPKENLAEVVIDINLSLTFLIVAMLLFRNALTFTDTHWIWYVKFAIFIMLCLGGIYLCIVETVKTMAVK